MMSMSDAEDVLSIICSVIDDDVRILTTIVIFGPHKRNKIPNLTKENLLFAFSYESLVDNNADFINKITSYMINSFQCAFTRENNTVVWNVNLDEEELKNKFKTEFMENLTLWGSTSNKIERTENNFNNTLGILLFNKIITFIFGLPQIS